MNIRVIEAQKPSVKKKKRRVAAYCRVSTDNTDQLESLETQKSHYESLIQLHTEWENAGLYYDTGITGTKADIREGLQNLLTACRIGKVDLILVKSISRLSRNTTDCLSIVRELINIGVTIFFEKENINTAEMESELIAWSCNTHIVDIRRCSAKYVRDDVLKAAFIIMLNKLIFSRKLILRPLYDSIRSDSTDESVQRMQELQKRIEKNTEKKNTLRQLRAQSIIDNVMYNQELNLLRKASDDYRNELAVLSCYTSAEAHEVTELEKLLRFAESAPIIEQFDDELFQTFVDHIVVYGRDCIEFKLKCGLTLKEAI